MFTIPLLQDGLSASLRSVLPGSGLKTGPRPLCPRQLKQGIASRSGDCTPIFVSNEKLLLWPFSTDLFIGTIKMDNLSLNVRC